MGDSLAHQIHPETNRFAGQVSCFCFIVTTASRIYSVLLSPGVLLASTCVCEPDSATFFSLVPERCGEARPSYILQLSPCTVLGEPDSAISSR